jgi:hypothetical protein
MERSHAIVIAVFVAALALFGLKVWSDRAADSDLAAGSRAARERLARAGGSSGADDSDSWGGSGSGSDRSGAPGERGSMRPGSLAGSGARMGAGGDRRGGSADVARGGGSGPGSGLGYGTGSRMVGGGGSGGTVGGGEGGGRLGPSVQAKDSLVHFLGSQPPTQSDLASAKADNGTDSVALKLDNTDDIAKQGGQEQNVQPAQDGDGIKIADNTDLKFPNNVNPDAATISMKVQPDWSGGDQSDNALLELRGEHDWSNRIELVKNGEFLRFIVTPDSGQEADISVRITDWQAGQEHDVQASYGNGQTFLYIDGKLAGSNQYTGQLNFPQGIPLRVGGDYPGSNYGAFNGTMSSVQITNGPGSSG